MLSGIKRFLSGSDGSNSNKQENIHVPAAMNISSPSNFQRLGLQAMLDRNIQPREDFLDRYHLDISCRKFPEESSFHCLVLPDCESKYITRINQKEQSSVENVRNQAVIDDFNFSFICALLACRGIHIEFDTAQNKFKGIP